MQQKDAQIQQKTRELEQQTTELNSVQQSIQVQWMTFVPSVSGHDRPHVTDVPCLYRGCVLNLRTEKQD